MAFARFGIVELARQRRRATAAEAVAHHQDFVDLELADRELQRRRDAVKAVARLIGRGEAGDVAHDEDLAGPGIENLRRIDAAVRARQDHDPRALALGELRPALALARPVVLAEAAIAVDQLV